MYTIMTQSFLRDGKYAKDFVKNLKQNYIYFPRMDNIFISKEKYKKTTTFILKSNDSYNALSELELWKITFLSIVRCFNNH